MLAFVLPAFAAGSPPPPGATARCNDGTYSSSQHRSGTCSHHGGVAAWLAGAGASPGAVALGRTVLLHPRTKTTGCRRGALPDSRCSPGAYYVTLTRDALCSPTFRTSEIRNVPQSENFTVEEEYGMPAAYYGRSIEIDHIVPLELGGSNAIANLFPEPGSGGDNYHLKDRLENALHGMVCAGRMTLLSAQQEIAGNWEALYRRVLG